MKTDNGVGVTDGGHTPLDGLVRGGFPEEVTCELRPE